jgi:hypothetical protein
LLLSSLLRESPVHEHRWSQQDPSAMPHSVSGSPSHCRSCRWRGGGGSPCTRFAPGGTGPTL